MRQERSRLADTPKSSVVFQVDQSDFSALCSPGGPRGSVTKVETEETERIRHLVSSRPKLVHVGVASLFLRIQRGVLEDDLLIFLLFCESLYSCETGFKTESCLLPGELALS